MSRETDTMRRVHPLDREWAYLPAAATPEWLHGAWPAEAERVSLPHCWNQRDTFQQGVRYRQGDGFYGCRFMPPRPATVPEKPLWQLRSGGFYGTGEVWLNGARVARVDGQYLGFTLDVTPFLRADEENTLTVSLSNRTHPHVLPGKKMPDFLLHGGLAGTVALHGLPRVYLDDQSLAVLCHTLTASSADLEVRGTVWNQGGTPVPCDLHFTVLAPDGSVVRTFSHELGAIPVGGGAPLSVPLRLDAPQRWHVDDPALHTLRAELCVEGEVRDRIEKRFGVRTAVFDGARGFLLNGEPLYLQGVNRHECVPGLGNALPEFLHRRDAAQIKSFGLNLVRLAHYPQHPAFLDACDECGVLVYAEIASWKSARPGPWARAACRQLEAMVRRDRHHPSVILWGLANESRSRIAFKQMTRRLKSLDPTRDTIYAENHLHRGIRWRTLKSVDVLGVNYEVERLEDARLRSRKGAVLISELSNCPRTRRGDWAAEAEQVAVVHADLARAEAHGGAAGYTLWCFNDYPTQRKERYVRRPGVVDAWRLPKMLGDYLRARTLKQPVLRVIGHWTSCRGEETERTVYILTNCTRVRVECRGKTVLEQDGEWFFTVRIPYSDGPLDVVGFMDGKEVAKDSLRPYGRATRLVMKSEVTEAKGCQTLELTVQAVDEQAEVDQDWMDPVQVETKGPVRDHCYTPDRRVEMGAGQGRFYVRGSGEPGESIIRVAHPELAAAEVKVTWE